MNKFSAMCLCILCFLTLCACENETSNKPPVVEDINPPVHADFDQEKYDYSLTPATDFSNKTKTLYQASSNWREEIDLDADEIMLFALSYSKVEELVQSWKGKGKTVSLMLPLGRDTDQFYVNGSYDLLKTGKQTTHTEIIQRDKDGNLIWHSALQTTPYVLPDAGFANYLLDFSLKGLRAGATNVFIEEPDCFKRTGYEDAFVKLYTEKYGSYERQEDSAEALRRTDLLKAEILTHAMDIISTGIKKEFPSAKVYLCTHSNINYMHHQCVVDNTSIVNLPNVDGVVGQAWSDTTMSPVTYDGVLTQEKVFEYGYMEYSEFTYYTGDTQKEVFTLSDPSSDSPDLANTPLARDYYQQNVITQFLNPRISAYEILPWPERCYESTSREYKSVLDGVFKIMNESTYTMSLTGSKGVGVVSSYTSMANLDIQRAKDSHTALAMPLISRGIPVEMLVLDTISSEMLKDIKVLVLSYEQIKPLQKKYSEIIAEWVKDGGTLLYIGSDRYVLDASYQWKEDGFNTPAEQLFSLLGKNFNQLKNKYETSFAAGKGNVLYYNETPDYFSKSESNRQVYYDLLSRAFALRGEKVKYADAMIAYKGKEGENTTINAYKTFDATLELKGKFVDLFSDDLEILVDPVVPENSYALYAEIYEDNIFEPMLAFTNATETIEENYYERTVVFFYNNTNSYSKSVFFAPDGLIPSVRVFRSDNVEIQDIDVIFSKELGTLYVKFYSKNKGARIEIDWGFDEIDQI